MTDESNRDILVVENQECPVCMQPKAVFSEYETEDPFAGPIAIFSIKCLACGFRNSDLEFVNPGIPAEYSIEVTSVEDLNIRIIKSGDCEIKIPTFRISVDSTMNSEGFISNIEGVLERFKKQIEFLIEDEEDKAKRKKGRVIINGINDVLRGEKPMTLKLVDKSGNSAIISDKASMKKLKK